MGQVQTKHKRWKGLLFLVFAVITNNWTSLEAMLRRGEQPVRRGRVVPGVPQAYEAVAAEPGRPFEEVVFLSAQFGPFCV